MLNKYGITFKATAFFLLLSLPILAVFHIYSFYESSKIIVNLAEKNSRALGMEVAHQVTAKIKPIEDIIANIGYALENPDLTADAIVKLTSDIVSNNEGIFGSAIAFEPYTMFADRLFFCPYTFRNGKDVKTKMLGGSDYRYFHQDWYQLPKQLGEAVWTEPYFDSGGGDILMATYTVPFYHQIAGQKHFAGVVTADISLAWLQEYIDTMRLYDTGYAVLMSSRGLLLNHPVKEYVLNETIFSLAEERGDEELWNIGKEAIAGSSGFLERTNYNNGKLSFFYYRPLPVAGWSVAFLFPREEVLAEITNLIHKNLVLSLLGFLILTLAISWLARRFTRPLIDLSRSAGEISKGNLNTPIAVLKRHDELGQLSLSFSEMQQSLNHHIAQLAETTAKKERIESELRIASNIQMSILPKLFPPFPERSEFDVYATIKPAREIGGDLYDFFFIDDHRFCFLIGDVSDKGVPAALFMAVTKTLLKVLVEQYAEPGIILEKANDDLAEGNDSCMFVTLFLAILDVRTGRIQTGNAGHNPPILNCETGPDFLPTLREPLAGAMKGLTYTTSEYVLKPGDTLFLYTDGITEAFDSNGQLYGEKRLLQEFSASPSLVPEKVVKTIDASLQNFAEGAEQADDITMLCLRFNGGTA